MTSQSRSGPETAAARHRELAAGLVNGRQLMQQGRADDAIAHCRALLDSWPGNADVLRYLGLACLHARRLPEAEQHLSEALRQEPGSANLLNDLGIVHLRQQAFEDAQARFTEALEIEPNHGDALGNIAVLHAERNQPARAHPYLLRLTTVLPFSGIANARAAGNSLLLDRVDEALRFGRKAVRCAPQLAEARLALADALETSGRFRQAKFQYLTVLRREPRRVAALARLLSLKRTDIDPGHAVRAEELLASQELQDSERAQLHLALARYFDQRQEYDLAFGQLQSGNAITWKRQAFDSRLFSQAVDSILQVFTPEFLQRRTVRAVSDMLEVRPIFIVGMPRSGTTLVEQILASHSQVEAGGELSVITNLAAEVSQGGEPYPRGMRAVDSTALAHMAERYRAKLETIAPDAPFVTDKMPFNFMHLGLIAMLFPDAAIIHCRRAPLDTCLSCYFTSFGENLLFAGELEALGRYYLDYRRMMAHWHAALPNAILDVDYEQLVGATDETVRTMLDWCGLDWEAGCLEFYRTERGIRTPSRWQVRQPIYQQSVGRWRHYENHLRPLLEVLSPVLDGGDGPGLQGGGP